MTIYDMRMINIIDTLYTLIFPERQAQSKPEIHLLIYTVGHCIRFLIR